MSGLEVAGLALALLPLLISAAENYDRCALPFSRYRKFVKEAKRFLQELDIQKVIFHNQCRILLEEILDQDTATSMMRNPDHHSWHDVELEERLVQLLKTSGEACITTIELIRERLEAIETDCRSLSASLAANDQVTPNAKKDTHWKDHIATKLRFSISKSRLRNHLKDLQTYNDNLRTLATHSLEPSSRARKPNKNITKDIEQEVEKFASVRKASAQVYEALGRACTKHTEHLAHTCAEVECTCRSGSQVHRLNFRMALAGSSDGKTSLSFIVTATLDEFESWSYKNPDLEPRSSERSQKRQLDHPSDHSERKSKKTVRFETSIRPPIPEFPTITIVDPFTLDDSLRRDFCDHLRRYSNQSLPPEMCMGTLGLEAGCKKFVFPAIAPSCASSQQAVSLNQLISSLPKHTRIGSFPLYERLRLAKILTIAVLQFHSTPWLQTTWASNDVTFFGKDALSLLEQTSALKAPHLYAKVRGPCEQLSGGMVRVEGIAGARNSLLYSLGILLLEIGYWKTWETLRDCEVADGERQNPYSQFYRARKLLKSGRSGMGPRYDGLVEQLIECDFGCGDDLSNSRLQMAVHRDVICPLEELEKGIKKLQLGT